MQTSYVAIDAAKNA